MVIYLAVATFRPGQLCTDRWDEKEAFFEEKMQITFTFSFHHYTQLEFDSQIWMIFRCSLPKAMSISRSEILRRKAGAETEVEKLPSVKVLESVSLGYL